MTPPVWTAPRPASRAQRAVTLARWLGRYARGRCAREYQRGAWLRELQGYPGIPGSVQEFEYERQRLTQVFYAAGLPMPASCTQAEELWQRPQVRNHLFSFIGRRELHPLRWLRWMRWLPWSGRICEFGAGAAPLAHGLTRAWPFPRPHVDVVDVPWALLDYCRWRFWAEPRVTVRPAPTPGRLVGWPLYDAMVLTETLEHLPEPLEWVVYVIWPLLRPGARLLWDYGVQTRDQPLAPQGQRARAATIAWLLAHGRVLNGGRGDTLTVTEVPREGRDPTVWGAHDRSRHGAWEEDR